MEPGRSLPAQRAADADRDAAAEALRAAGADGRLNVEEMEERLSAVFAARTHPELDVLLADLQGQGPARSRGGMTTRGEPTVRDASTRPETQRTVTIMGENTRRGFWRPAASSQVLTVMGESTIDLTEAQLSRPVTELRAITIMGTALVEVPDHVNLHVTKVTILGENIVDVPGTLIPGAPELHVRLVSILGRATLRLRRRRGAELYA